MVKPKQLSKIAVLPALAIGLAALAGLPACDGGQEDRKREELEAFAQTALEGDADEATKKAREADEARRKKEFEEKKAKEEAEKKRVEAIYADIVKLPEKMPKSVEKACELAAGAYEPFFVAQNEGDDGALLNFYDNKKKTLGERRGKCLKVNNLEAAACQIHALENAPKGELKGYELDLLRACVEKFAPDTMGDLAVEGASE